jgi:hypothetical protein
MPLLAVLGSPLARWAGLALAGLGALAWAYWKGAAHAGARCEAAALRAQIAVLHADLSAAQRAADQAADLGARLRVVETRNMELAHELAKSVSPDECRLNDDLARRLRAIQ